MHLSEKQKSKNCFLFYHLVCTPLYFSAGWSLQKIIDYCESSQCQIICKRDMIEFGAMPILSLAPSVHRCYLFIGLNNFGFFSLCWPFLFSKLSFLFSAASVLQRGVCGHANTAIIIFFLVLDHAFKKLLSK